MAHVRDSGREVLGALPEEHPLRLLANGTLLATLLCTPASLDELALGWCLSQGLPVSGETSVRVVTGPRGSDVEIDVAVPERLRWVRYREAGYDAATLQVELARQVAPDAGLERAGFESQLRAAFDHFRAERGAGGYHHAALISDREVFVVRIDLSRHCVVDKIVGAALQQRIDSRRTAIVLSGRITADIVLKAASLGAPVLATRGLPTRQAVALAEACGVRLVCRALDHRRLELGAERLRG